MKTNVRNFTRMMTMALAIVMTTATAFADGETTDAYTSGTTNGPAGNFVVKTTGDIFNFQGEEYEVYKVYYDDPSMNVSIAVREEGRRCKHFIAFSKEYTMFYECNKDGFGVRKVMFSNPDAHKKFNPDAFNEQTVLTDNKKIDKKQAIEIIAGFLPSMQEK